MSKNFPIQTQPTPPLVRNGVPLFKPVAGAPTPTLALINELRDEDR
jgi:hypothetical protein